MYEMIDRRSPEALERLRDAVHTRLACDVGAERAGGLPPNPAVTPDLGGQRNVTAAETAALDADDAELDRVITAMEQDMKDGITISHELARYLARTLDAAAAFAAKMPLYVQRADVGSWATDVKVSSTSAAASLRRAVLAAELPDVA